VRAQTRVAPRSCYAICATPRTGTNLLCERLWLTGVAGRPEEHFLLLKRRSRPDAVLGHADLETVLADGTTPNGVFGTKIMWDQLEGIIDMLRSIAGDFTTPAHGLLAAFLPGLRYVHVSRRDKVRQAVSLAKAVQSGRWSQYEPMCANLTPEQIRQVAQRLGLDASQLQMSGLRSSERSTSAAVRYDFDLISDLHRTLLEHDTAWKRYFDATGVVPFTLTYEDTVADLDASTCAILDYLGIASPPPLPFEIGGMQRQGDAVNDEWATRFAADRANRLQ